MRTIRIDGVDREILVCSLRDHSHKKQLGYAVRLVLDRRQSICIVPLSPSAGHLRGIPDEIGSLTAAERATFEMAPMRICRSPSTKWNQSGAAIFRRPAGAVVRIPVSYYCDPHNERDQEYLMRQEYPKGAIIVDGSQFQVLSTTRIMAGDQVCGWRVNMEGGRTVDVRLPGDEQSLRPDDVVLPGQEQPCALHRVAHTDQCMAVFAGAEFSVRTGADSPSVADRTAVVRYPKRIITVDVTFRRHTEADKQIAEVTLSTPAAAGPKCYLVPGENWDDVEFRGRRTDLLRRQKVKAFLRHLWDKDAVRHSKAVPAGKNFPRPSTLFGPGQTLKTVRIGEKTQDVCFDNPEGVAIHRLYDMAVGKVPPRKKGKGRYRYYLRVFADSDST